ncbi:hypothetical protein JI435_431170 [Parastagonospora nodorum SN15]|uniref:Uncharacterized protein n=1 Tax=Phaeosphaeria nodorum (strain SN15 / ATCC MYA-4574 / FGSC 10173) TaxID=321614 RepID=A0A7U2HZX8_PHANO|nr:hypothetical protein JI435_431170 [Parastagonospora nodorum SN15]
MTLSEYHDLRASTTISLTETAITSGAGPGLETVAAVVFAGGIACHRHKSLKAPEKMTIAVKIKARSLIATMAVATTPGGYVRAETGRTDPAKNKTAQRIKPLVAPPKTAMAMCVTFELPFRLDHITDTDDRTPACNAPPKVSSRDASAALKSFRNVLRMISKAMKKKTKICVKQTSSKAVHAKILISSQWTSTSTKPFQPRTMLLPSAHRQQYLCRNSEAEIQTQFQDIRRKRTQARSVSMGKSAKRASENYTDTSPEPHRISHESPRSTASVEITGQLFGPWHQRQQRRVGGARSLEVLRPPSQHQLLPRPHLPLLQAHHLRRQIRIHVKIFVEQ